MKKVLMFLLVCIMVFSFASCSDKADNSILPTDAPEATAVPTEPVDAKVLAIKGPTGMGMAKLMEQGYEVELFTGPELVNPEIIKGNFDIAAVPVNVAALLYQKTGGELKIAAVNTLGTLHIVENGNTINSVKDLVGKTVYFSNAHSAADYAFKYILTQNGIDPDKDIELLYLSAHDEVAAKLKTGDVKIGVLPEPFVTTATMGSENLRDAVDLSKEWDLVAENNSKLTMGCIVVSKDFAENHKEDLDVFLAQYKASIEYVNANVDEASELIAKHGIIPKAAIAKKAIPGSNMAFPAGEEMKAAAGGFINVMYESAPESVGGKLPDDAFYYMG